MSRGLGPVWKWPYAPPGKSQVTVELLAISGIHEIGQPAIEAHLRTRRSSSLDRNTSHPPKPPNVRWFLFLLLSLCEPPWTVYYLLFAQFLRIIITVDKWFEKYSFHESNLSLEFEYWISCQCFCFVTIIHSNM